MDSRLIYKASQHLHPHWENEGVDGGWMYYGDDKKIKSGLIIAEINKHLTTTEILLVLDRTTSKKILQESAFESIKEHLLTRHFLLWDIDLKHVIEFNLIGVFRKGTIVSSI